MNRGSSSDRDYFVNHSVHHLTAALQKVREGSGAPDDRLRALRKMAVRLQTHVEEMSVWDEDEGYLRTLFNIQRRSAV